MKFTAETIAELQDAVHGPVFTEGSPDTTPRSRCSIWRLSTARRSWSAPPTP